MITLFCSAAPVHGPAKPLETKPVDPELASSVRIAFSENRSSCPITRKPLNWSPEERDVRVQDIVSTGLLPIESRCVCRGVTLNRRRVLHAHPCANF